MEENKKEFYSPNTEGLSSGDNNRNHTQPLI